MAEQTWTYDLDTPTGQVRLFIGDTQVDDAELRIFSDQELAVFLTMNSGDVRLAAADGLDRIAAVEAYILKVVTVLDVRTDGKATAEGIRAAANALRAAVKNDAMDTIEVGIASMAVNKWTTEEIWRRSGAML